ncbi:unnamed protein product [Prunus brigantina]
MTLKFLKANYCTALESIEFVSHMSNMRELDLKDCRNLDDIPGLEDSSKFTETIHMEGCTNLSARFKKNVLEVISLSLTRMHQSQCSICNAYTKFSPHGIAMGHDSQSSGRLSLTVTNRTQRTVFSIFPMTVSGVTPHEDYLWLGRIPNNGLNLKGGDKAGSLLKQFPFRRKLVKEDRLPRSLRTTSSVKLPEGSSVIILTGDPRQTLTTSEYKFLEIS